MRSFDEIIREVMESGLAQPGDLYRNAPSTVPIDPSNPNVMNKVPMHRWGERGNDTMTMDEQNRRNAEFNNQGYRSREFVPRQWNDVVPPQNPAEEAMQNEVADMPPDPMNNVQMMPGQPITRYPMQVMPEPGMSPEMSQLLQFYSQENI